MLCSSSPWKKVRGCWIAILDVILKVEIIKKNMYQKQFLNTGESFSISSSSNLYKGFIFATLLILAQINQQLGVILILSSFLLLTQLKKLNAWEQITAMLVAFKIGSIVFIDAIFGGFQINAVATIIMQDILLFVALFCRVDLNFIRGFAKGIIVLFMVDFAFNLNTFFTGADFFDRAIRTRPGDLSLRYGGVFGHAFASINISLLALFSAYFLKQRFILILAILILLINSSLRGPVSVVLIFSIFLLAKLRIPLWIYIFFALFFVTSLVFATYFVSLYEYENYNYISANGLRVFAWQNAIALILESPIIGSHDFLQTEDQLTMNFDTVEDFGITESYFLKLWVHYGIFPVLTAVIIYTRLVSKFFKNFKNNKNLINFVTFIIITYACIDKFYGSFWGATLTSTFIGLFCFCFSGSIIINERDIHKKSDSISQTSNPR